MFSPAQFDTFDEAYIGVLRHVLDHQQYANAPRGNASREVIGASFQLADPTARVPFVAARKVNPIYNLAEALWYLAGRADLGMIGHYAPVRRGGTPMGVPADESAYGPRVFRRIDGQSRFTRALELLRTQADTKRAVIPVFEPSDLDDPTAPAIPCLVGLHLLLREGRLHMVTYMRANDADRGLIADVHSFTLIQELAARQLGVALGTYTHHVGSLHIAEGDLSRVSRVLAEADAGGRPRFQLPEMPKNASWDDIEKLLRVEEALRTNAAAYSAIQIAAMDLDPYWQQAVLLLEAYRQITYCGADPVEPEIVAELHPGYRWLLSHRWPDRVPSAVTR